MTPVAKRNFRRSRGGFAAPRGLNEGGKTVRRSVLERSEAYLDYIGDYIHLDTSRDAQVQWVFL